MKRETFYPLNMTDMELLSMVCDSVPIAKKVKEIAPTLQSLNKLTVDDLTQVPGIGESKAKKILSIIEMARRMKYEQVPIKTRIKSSQDAYLALVLMTNLDNLTHEEFWCMYLNHSNQVIKYIRISEGGISGTITDVRLIFNHAIKLLASGIILCHNHPSGNLSPSDADLKITKKIKDAGTLLDVSVLDHLIVSAEGFTSLADDNLI